MEEVIENPPGDNGIKGHQGEVSHKGQHPDVFPSGFWHTQFPEHVQRTGLRRTSDGKLHGHHRKPQEKQTDDVDKYKTSSAEFTAHPRKFPDISAADGATG